MVDVGGLKYSVLVLISCILATKYVNATALQANFAVANGQTKLALVNEQSGLIGKKEENTIPNPEKLKDDDEADESDDDKKEDKKNDKIENKDEKNDEDDAKADNKKNDEDNKNNDKNDSDDKDDDKKEDDKKESDEKKVEEKTKGDTEGKAKKIDEKLDDNQKKTKPQNTNFDDSSQEDDSHSNPDTEEEGESQSESDEDDKLEKEEKEPLKGKLEHKLLIILASGFRYDYLHIQKLDAIKEILKTGVMAKVRPVFPSNTYPNYYALMTGLHPVRSGFIDDEMFDVKYKERFSDEAKEHNHKHWWNKAEPLWITAMNNKIKVASYYWKGACGITIKGKKPKNCVPYKERVSFAEVNKQLESIVEQFKENKLDLALVSYELIDKAGHDFGPESFKLRKAVRNFDKLLTQLMKNIDENNIEDKVNLVVVSDHGMTSVGERIDLEKFIDFNDIDKFVNSGTFAMLLPEDDKKDYVFNLLRNAHIEGLNVYKKPDFPERFNFGKGDAELILPIVLTADKGYYIGEPNINKNGDEDEAKDSESPKKGLHGFHPVFSREMNSAMFATGPDLEKNQMVNTVNQVDLYNVFCRLIKIKPIKNDGNKNIVDDFIHGSSSEEHGQEENGPDSDENSGDISSYAPEKKHKDSLPVYKSRWALRGAADSISLSLSLQLTMFLISLVALVQMI